METFISLDRLQNSSMQSISMSPIQYGKMSRSGWVCTNNRCWLRLSRIMCFVTFEVELKTRKMPRNGVYINNRCWPGLSRIKYFVVVEVKLKTSIPNCSMLKGMHIAYYEIIV
jgi:hypothetical protein